MNPTPLRALSPSRRQLLAATAVSLTLFVGACSSPATSDGSSSSSTLAAPATSTASGTAAATEGTSPSATAPSVASAAPSGTASGSAAPTAQTALKELVAGFPTKVIALPKGAEVQSSSFEEGSPVSAASVIANSSEKPAEILAFYTKSLTAQGFKAQPGDAVDGVPLKTYVRAAGQEIVTVSVVVTSAISTFTVGATLLPASLK